MPCAGGLLFLVAMADKEKQQPKRRGRPAKAMPDSPALIDIPTLSVHQQIGVMQRLNLQTVAWLLGLTSARTLTQNMRLERNQDGTVDARKVLEYATTLRYRRTDRPGDVARMQREQVEVEVDASTIGALDHKRMLEAQKIELEILRMQKELVPVDQTVEFFGELSARLRSFGETLQRDFGPNALLLLNELLTGMEAHVERWVESVRDSDD